MRCSYLPPIAPQDAQRAVLTMVALVADDLQPRGSMSGGGPHLVVLLQQQVVLIPFRACCFPTSVGSSSFPKTSQSARPVSPVPLDGALACVAFGPPRLIDPFDCRSSAITSTILRTARDAALRAIGGPRGP